MAKIVTCVTHVMNIVNLRHYVIMLSHAFAIFIEYVISKNSIYIMLYKYLVDTIYKTKA